MRTLAAVILLTAVLSAQAPEPPPPPYVASVKVNNSGPGQSFTRRLPGGTLLASNVTLLDMIAMAHGLQPFQVEGGPDWMRHTRFDITIKTEVNVAPAAIGPSQLGLQLGRAVLAERFALKAHRETRERPVFALVRARPDGALGPRLNGATPIAPGSPAWPENPARPGRPGPPPAVSCAVCRSRETR
jgi:uncharacterized protein (TIGR03435 family)